MSENYSYTLCWALFAITTISVFRTVGAEADEEKLEFLLTELKDKDITEVIAAGRERLSSVPSGGGAIDMGAPAAVAGGGAAPAEEAKKEEKVEEKEESDEVSVSHLKQLSACLFGIIICSDYVI
jgi:large subunit ribosomal protein LP2